MPRSAAVMARRRVKYLERKQAKATAARLAVNPCRRCRRNRPCGKQGKPGHAPKENQ